MTHLPLLDPPRQRVLSVRQPWAHLIIYHGKDIENRDWVTTHVGPLLIHAAKRLDCPIDDIERDFGIRLDADRLQFGGIIGSVYLEGITADSNSRWFFGPWGWMLRDPRPLPFRPLRGQLGLFDLI